ncbi:MAG: NAD(P)-binding domain-containing protein [Steroidobacteraceae bacterium]
MLGCASGRAAAASDATISPQRPEVIAIIGTGRVAGALGPRIAQQGYRVIYGSREPARPEHAQLLARTGGNSSVTDVAKAVAGSDWVLLAVPWSALGETLRNVDLGARLVIDPVNALRSAADGLLEPVDGESAGQWLQRRFPEARVVKAFNTVGFHVMADPALAGGPVTIPMAGDDAKAKASVGELVRKLGFAPLDLGPIRNARWLEGLAALYMVPYMSGRRQDAFEIYLRTHSAPPGAAELRPAG